MTHAQQLSHRFHVHRHIDVQTCRYRSYWFSQRQSLTGYNPSLTLMHFLRKKASTAPAPERKDTGGEACSESKNPQPITTPNGKQTAISLFKSSLQLLGHAPVPGIDIATAGILAVLNSFQEMGEAESGWKELADRMNRLWALTTKLGQEDSEADFQVLFGGLIRELQQLQKDLESTTKQGRIQLFLTSTDSLSCIGKHREELDMIITETTLAITASTKQGVRKIQEDIKDMIKAQQFKATENNDGITSIMENNVLGSVQEDFEAYNTTSNRAKILHDARGNVIGFIGGSAFSHNHAG